MNKCITILLLLLTFVGCQSTYKGGTLTDGDTLQIGLKTPIASSTSTSLQVLNWVNGFTISWEDDVNIQIKRDSIEVSDALGIWSNTKTNSTEIVVTKKEVESK